MVRVCNHREDAEDALATALLHAYQAADKLEEANKNFGTLILISAGTYEQVKDDVEARELDHVKVYARAQPTTVYCAFCRQYIQA